MAALSTDVQIACSIDSIIMCENKLKQLQGEQTEVLPTDCKMSSGSTEDSQESLEEVTSTTSMVGSLRQGTTSMNEEEASFLHRARLDCWDGKLLLHCLTPGDHSRLFLQVIFCLTSNIAIISGWFQVQSCVPQVN